MINEITRRMVESCMLVKDPHEPMFVKMYPLILLPSVGSLHLPLTIFRVKLNYYYVLYI